MLEKETYMKNIFFKRDRKNPTTIYDCDYDENKCWLCEEDVKSTKNFFSL